MYNDENREFDPVGGDLPPQPQQDRTDLSEEEMCIRDRIIGVLEIPTLELVMPVYLGASDSHLAAGAAVLGNTSAPIGGVNTNCVIAGHRGWYGADYFRHIDRLQAGDTVTITNLWETLTYACLLYTSRCV